MFFLLLIGDFLAGALLCNCIPHLAAGLRGEPLPTPFAKPPGQGLSSPATNVLWGSLNLFLGWWCLHAAPVEFGLNLNFALVIAGFVGVGVPMSRHFESVRTRGK